MIWGLIWRVHHPMRFNRSRTGLCISGSFVPFLTHYKVSDGRISCYMAVMVRWKEGVALTCHHCCLENHESQTSTQRRLKSVDTMRRPDIEEGDAAQPLLPEALDDEALDDHEGRQPSWWEAQNVGVPDSPVLSAFAATGKSIPGTPNGSRGLESGRQSPRTVNSGATRKGNNQKGGTRESRARQAPSL